MIELQKSAHIPFGYPKQMMVMMIHVRQLLFIKLDDIPRPLLNDIGRTLTIENPAYMAAEKAGRWTGGLDKFLSYYQVRANNKGETAL